MHIEVSQRSLASLSADALVVSVTEGSKALAGVAAVADQALNGEISAALETGDFTGKRGTTLVLYPHGRMPYTRLVVIGLGQGDDLDLGGIRWAAATAAARLKPFAVTSLVVAAYESQSEGELVPGRISQATVEGTLLALYRFQAHRQPSPQDEKLALASLTLLVAATTDLEQAQHGAQVGQVLAESVYLARTLVNEPANYLTPTGLAERAEQMAAEVGLHYEVMGPEEMRQLGMGLLLAVAAGSAQPPRLIVLEHNADRADLPTVALVGKGITFDSGGVTIKPGENMWLMKGDMGGAAAVLSAVRSASLLKLPLHVVALIPSSENLPDGRAMKPGDVYTGMNGKTVEVISTDAEGRMVLGDAMAYAVNRFHPQALIDVATLTGSISIAIGRIAAGLFSNNRDLVARLQTASQAAGERIWEMPTWKEYGDAIQSDFADIKNTGGRYGGACIAAAFLAHFNGDVPWAHLDMAGTSWEESGNALTPKGAAGWGVRLLTEMLRGW